MFKSLEISEERNIPLHMTRYSDWMSVLGVRLRPY